MGISKKANWLMTAQDLYATGQIKTLEELANRVPVSTKTLGKWRQDYNWDEKRENYLVSAVGAAGKLRKIIYHQIELLDEQDSNNHIIGTSDVDRMTKLIASLDKLEKRIDLRGSVVLVMNRFVDFLKARHPEHLDFFYKIMKEFYDYVEEIA